VGPFIGILDSPQGSMASSSRLIPRAVILTAIFGIIFPASGFETPPRTSVANFRQVRTGASGEPLAHLAIIPPHPFRRLGCQLEGVPLEFGQVLERMIAVKYFSRSRTTIFPFCVDKGKQ
jgi:hypothetical protein